ncbi:uncharacterized protein C8orf58 homolog [Pyxicephalus adspersus]|uniref:uncharacterized protein C8orf58 homolog n=1 Tax=Pyxicephalus adspersus TaxID=30357 RepID=UPI003B5A50AA
MDDPSQGHTQRGFYLTIPHSLPHCRTVALTFYSTRGIPTSGAITLYIYLSKMLGRHRKLNLGALWSEERSEGCVLLGSTAVYRPLMDSSSNCGISRVSHYPKSIVNHGGHGGYTVIRKHFEKSESEDSGVEMPPPSPYGSESSYNPDESESVESSNPEEPESLESPTPEASPNLNSLAYGKPDHFQPSQETTSVEYSFLENPGSSNMHAPRNIHPLEYCITKQHEEDISNMPHKVEQAILRSRKQRSSSREAIQIRAARCSRQSASSQKEQHRGKSVGYEGQSSVCQSVENEGQDVLNLPGDGLRYLENLCHMLEQMAELQQRNQKLQHQKKTLEKKLQSQVLFLDSCVCGSSRDSRDLEQDMADNPLPNGTSWQPQHYRKRSSSHAGVLLGLATQPENNLKQTIKLDPQYVSVPNLQETERRRTTLNCKAEPTQWFKVKDLLSKLAKKNSSPSAPQGTQSNCRTQTMLGRTPQHSKRLFLPGLVIRPRNHGRQLY